MYVCIHTYIHVQWPNCNVIEIKLKQPVEIIVIPYCIMLYCNTLYPMWLHAIKQMLCHAVTEETAARHTQRFELDPIS